MKENPSQRFFILSCRYIVLGYAHRWEPEQTSCTRVLGSAGNGLWEPAIGKILWTIPFFPNTMQTSCQSLVRFERNHQECRVTQRMLIERTSASLWILSIERATGVSRLSKRWRVWKKYDQLTRKGIISQYNGCERVSLRLKIRF